LLPLESTDFLGNFDDGNKSKTIANRDQKIRGIPSTTMLRLGPIGKTTGICAYSAWLHERK